MSAAAIFHAARCKILLPLAFLFSSLGFASAGEVYSARDILLEKLPDISRALSFSEELDLVFDPLFYDGIYVTFFREADTEACALKGCLHVFVFTDDDQSTTEAVILFSNPIEDYTQLLTSGYICQVVPRFPQCDGAKGKD